MDMATALAKLLVLYMKILIYYKHYLSLNPGKRTGRKNFAPSGCRNAMQARR